MLDNHYAIQCNALHPPRNACRDQLSVSALAIMHKPRIFADQERLSLFTEFYLHAPYWRYWACTSAATR